MTDGVSEAGEGIGVSVVLKAASTFSSFLYDFGEVRGGPGNLRVPGRLPPVLAQGRVLFGAGRPPRSRPARGPRARWHNRCHVRAPLGGIPAPRKPQMCSSFGVICLWGEKCMRQNGGVGMWPEGTQTPGLSGLSSSPGPGPQAGPSLLRPRCHVQDAAWPRQDLAGSGALVPRPACSAERAGLV